MKNNRQKHIKKFASALISIVLIFAIVPFAIFVNAESGVSAVPYVSLAPCEVPVLPTQINPGDPQTEIHSSNVSYNANGASVVNGLAAYSNTTIEGMFERPAKDFYKNAAGIDTSNVGNTTWNQILDMTPEEISALIKSYDNPPAVQSLNSAYVPAFLSGISLLGSNDGDVNPVEQMVDFTLDLVMSSVSSNVPEYSGLIEMVNNSTSMSDMFTDPVQHAGMVAAISVTSGTAPTQVDNTPLGDLLLDTVNNIDPKESGENYTDMVDFLIYRMEKDCGTVTTRDENVGVFIGKLIASDGEFVQRDSSYSYPSVFWINCDIDPDKTLDISIDWPMYSSLVSNLYVTFDNVQMSSPELEITGDDMTPPSVITLSGIFKEAGIHTVFINIYGSPMVIYLDLTDPNAPKPPTPPVTSPVTPPVTPITDPNNNSDENGSNGKSDNSIDIPNTGSKVVLGTSVFACCCIATAVVIKIKKKEND